MRVWEPSLGALRRGFFGRAVLAIGLLSLLGAYALPFALELRLPARTHTVALEQLRAPLIAFPTIAQPRASAPNVTRRHAHADRATPTRTSTERTHTAAPASRRVVRTTRTAPRVPVVTNRYTLVPQQKPATAPNDPFANAAVVEDTTGAPPVELPESAAAPTAPPSPPPAATATPTADPVAPPAATEEEAPPVRTLSSIAADEPVDTAPVDTAPVDTTEPPATDPATEQTTTETPPADPPADPAPVETITSSTDTTVDAGGDATITSSPEPVATPTEPQPTVTTTTTTETIVTEPSPAKLVVDTAAVDYASVTVGAPQTRTIELRNVGDGPLTILSLTIEGDGGATFTIATDAPSTIAGGAIVSVAVTASPTTLGVHTARLVIATDDASGSFAVDLVARGTTWQLDGTVAARGPPTADATVDHTIRFTADAVELIGADGSVDTISLTGVTSVSIHGGAGDDVLHIDAGGGLAVGISFDGGDGNDTLFGPSGTTTWSITGAGGGSITGGISFAGIENLRGAAGTDDTFVFDGGSIAVVDGGAGGNDGLVLASGSYGTTAYTFTGEDSGTISRDGDVITYAGLEPTTDATGGAKVVSAAVVTVSNPGGTNDNSFLVAVSPGEDITFSNASAITSLTINGTAGADLITINAADQQFTATITISGSASNDTYNFGDDFGTVTITGPDAGTDRVNFANHAGTLTLTANRATFTSSDGSTLNQPSTAADQAEEINVSLAAVTSLKTKLEETLDKLSEWVEGASSLAHEIQNVLPLLSADAAGNLAKLLQHVDAVKSFITSAKAAIPANPATLTALITALNGAAYSGLLNGVQFSTDYRGAGTEGASPAASGALEVFVEISRPETTVSRSIPLDLGPTAESLGIKVDANAATSGIQVPTVSVTAKFAALLEIGTTTTAGVPTVFLRPGGYVTLGLDASLNLAGLSIDVSFLHTTVPSGSLSLTGSVKVTLTDLPTTNDGRITASDFATGPLSALFAVTEPSPAAFSANVTVNVGAGVRLSGGATLATATFTANVSGSIFGSSTEPAKVNVTFTATPGGTLVNLLESFNNVGPNEILSMLQAVANSFGALAGSQILQTQIPFTGKKLGDVLAYATAFKESILDPLFVSGDLLRPDNNGDGAVTLEDLQFSSIQNLLDRLETALGLAAGTLESVFNPVSKELTFTFNFTKALGFGEVKATETQRGDATHNETQRLTVNGVSVTVTGIGNTFRLAFPDANNAIQFTDPIPLGSNPSFVAGKLAALTGIGGAANVAVTSPESSNYRTYNVEFKGTLAATNVPLLSSDAVDLAGSFALDFGAELGGLAGITTTGSFTLLATLVAGMTFGINLNASQSIEITPGVYTPAIDLRVDLPAGATNNRTQIVTVSNVNGGSYDLALDLDNNGTIASAEVITVASNATGAGLQGQLNGLTGVTSTVQLSTFGNHRIYTVAFTSPVTPPRIVADPTNLTGPATNGRLTGNASFTVSVLHPSVQVSDGTHVAQTLAASTAISSLSITVNSSATSGNASLADLGVDVEAAVNSALATGGYTAGWLLTAGDKKTLSTGVVGAGSNALAGNAAMTSAKADLPFTIVVKTNGGTAERQVTGRVRLVDLLDADANGSLFNGDGTVNMTELGGTFTATKLAQKLQAAIQEALANAGLGGFTVTVTTPSNLQLNVTAVPTTGDTVELRFTAPVQVDAGGGRISLSSPPVTLSAHTLRPGVTVDRIAQVSTPGFSSVAYQELGLQSAPTRLDGTTSQQISFTMVVNGTSVPVTVAAASRTSLNDLVTALNAQISSALTAASLASDLVVAYRIDPLGNRVGLRGKAGSVSTFALQVPLDVDSGTAGIQLNGAITELGLASGPGETHRALATEFFLENTSLTGTFKLYVPTVTLTATLGFLGLTASGSGTLPLGADADELFSATISIALKNPTSTSTNPNRVTLTQVANALRQGFFLFDPTQAGGTDQAPTTGVVAGLLGGGFGVKVTFTPAGALTGLSGTLSAFLEISASSPDWLLSPPSFSDPLGFGAAVRALGATATTLATVAPSNGVLTQDVKFVLSQGTREAVGFVRASDTTTFTTRAQLQAALQGAFNAALARLVAAGAAGGTVNVAIDGSGNVALTGTSGIGVRANVVSVNFTGPDVANVLDRFRNLSFTDVIQGLQALIDFLRTMQGTGGAGGAIASVLDAKLPLIDRSVSELVDLAAALGNRIDQIMANPSGSIQALESQIRAALGLGTGPPITSFDVGTGTVFFNFAYGKSVSISRPFSLSLADAGLPSFLSSIVGVSASGTLNANASLTLNLKLGLDLEGADKGFFIDVANTSLVAAASASGTNLEFEARLGPFGLFVKNGSAGAGASITVGLVNADADGRLYVFGLPGGATSDLDHLASFVSVGDFTTTGSIVVTQTGPGGVFASATLPLFIGTADHNVPLDFGSATPGAPDGPITSGWTTGKDNALRVKIDVVKLFRGQPGAFAFQTPDFDFSNFQLPSLFTLLSDPAVIVDGLDRLLLVLQDALSGQIFGQPLPFVGDLLKDNPAAKVLLDIRQKLLQPLATVLRENNATLATLVGLIQQQIVNVLGPGGPIATALGLASGLIKDRVGTSAGITIDDVLTSGVDLANPLDTTPYLQFDFDLDWHYQVAAPTIKFDLGIPVLGVDAQLTPTVRIDFQLHFGFGVHQDFGLYFVTSATPELQLGVSVTFSAVDCGGGTATRANVNGRLLFLALKIKDGVDLDGDASVDVNCGAVTNPKTEELSKLFLTGSVDIDDPNHDGKLTIAEMVSGSFRDIVKPNLIGGAVLRTEITVDFSTISADVGRALPKVTAALLVDFVITVNPSVGFQVGAPGVAIANITLDLGEFISKFAAPILNGIKEVLDPLAWLIGPDGFLNKRIPLLSDLAGRTITGKDLVVLFDPEHGPSVVAFLDFVEGLYNLINLVNRAAAEGNLQINFGDLVLSNQAYYSTGFSIINQQVSFSLPGGITDLRKAPTLKNGSLGSLPSDPFAAAPLAPAQQSFTSGVRQPGGFRFLLLEPENLLGLFMGKPVKIFEVDFPVLGFDFFYRQEFPIIGPLVGTFAGGVGAQLKLGFGYDTLGIQNFVQSGNPGALLDGFYLIDYPEAEATLTATIAVGAALSIVVAKVGVEGGITATILFDLADLDADGRVRFKELAENVIANDYNPLAVFDISGYLEFFLRAYIEINLFIAKITFSFEFARLRLFEFNIPFKRPAILGNVQGGVLTLHVGASAGQRLNGSLSDGNESISLESDGSDILVWSDQFDRPHAAAMRFSGVTKIFADGGPGNDVIDLSAITLTGLQIEIHGGAGNDQLKGSHGADKLFGDDGDDELWGNEGDDELHGGNGVDTLHGGDDDDKLFGDAGNDTLNGDGHDDHVQGGSGDDTYQRSSGDDVYELFDFGSDENITGTGPGSDTLDFTGMAVNLVLFLTTTTIDVGWQQTGGTAGTAIAHFEHRLHVLNAAGITSIKGGSFVDTFHVTGTAGAITLNGGKGNDVYDFYTGSSAITATVTDTGDPWNSGDLIQVIDGQSPFDTTQDDTIAVTSTTLTINAAATQVVTYSSPAADANVLSIRIDTRGGNDVVTVSSTSANVPVRVETGAGNDKVVVGGPTLNSIAGLSRPGLNAPFGVGPLVVVGGSGTDVISVDDSGEAATCAAGTATCTGTLTAFREQRVGVTDPVEVGVVTGFGMTLKDGGTTAAGRVEFEGMEIVELKLGAGADTVWIGGDALFGTGAGKLPQNRQDVITEFVHSPQAMKAVLTGGGADSIRVLSTALIPSRDSFSSALGLVSTSTSGAGLSQTLAISDAARGHGYFTLKLRYEETAPIRLGATALEIENELDKLLLVGNAANVSVSGTGPFTITFSATLVSVEQLQARLIPLLVNGQAGNDEVRAQAIYEETVLQGGNDNDHVFVNVNATSGAPLTYNEIVPDVIVSTTTQGSGGTNEVQQIVLQDVVGGTFRLSFNGTPTSAIEWDAPAATVQKRLEGVVGPGNVKVARTAPNTYLVEFQEGLGHTNVAQLTANASALRSNGVHAIVTADGQAQGDLYDVYLIGKDTDSVVNVFDTGGSGTDQLVVYGTNETFKPDVFLLRASTSDKGLAFIALINAPDPFAVQAGDPIERVNYNLRLETITVEGRDGDDQFYIDDTRAKITINAGKGNDFFQVGQLYQSRRTPELAGVAPEDVFATIETTRGWLSNGISNPMTINGDDGEDLFIVFHNIATLTLRGGADDDTFIVQAFALAGSQNPVRGLTDLSGDAGADSVQYAVNAPVKIDGGDGFDTVIVIGTEFPDDFVVTKNGVYGAGLNVNFVNIEFLEVDGAEGDDRFFVLSTGIGFTTVITGGLGTDLFSVQGPTPANGVISNDLLGHSGVITHSVEGTLAASEWSGLKVVGVSANVQDNDEPSVIVTATGGYSQVVQGATLDETAQGLDRYSVVLGRPPLIGETVRIDIAPVPGLVFLNADLSERRILGKPDGVQLDFTSANWWVPQWVRFKTDDSFVGELPDTADIQMSVVVALAFTDPIVEGGTITGTVSTAQSVDPDTSAAGDEYATMTTGDATFPTASAGLPQGIRGAQLKITGGDDEAAGQVRLILSNTSTSLTLNKPWSVEPSPGAIFEISLFSAVQLPTMQVRIFSAGRPAVVVDETEGSTSVSEGAGASGDDTIRVRLSSPLTGVQQVTVALNGGGQLAFYDGATQITSLTFTSSTWNVFKTLTVRAIDDLVVEGFHKADMLLSASGTSSYTNVTSLSVVDLGDNEWPGVRVLESNGSTNVIEFDPVNHGVSQAQAIADGLPFSDTHQVVLTKAPLASDPVTITVRAEPTRTSRTGGIRSFVEQVKVCVIGPGEPCTDPTHFAFEKTVTFDSTNWNTARTVVVRAVDDDRVDGQDAQVFAPTLDLLNNIQGPLFIRGGLGADRTGLFEREPVMLPGERNQKPSMGDVISGSEAVGGTPATITIDPTTLTQVEVSTTQNGAASLPEIQEIAVRATGGTFTLGFGGMTTAALPYNASALQVELALEAIGTGDVKVSQNSSVYKVTWKTNGNKAALTADASALRPLAPADLIDFSIQITEGAAKNKIRIVKNAVAAGPYWLLSLDKTWFSPFTADASVPDATSKYTLFATNPNLLVKEETQADILWVSDVDNPGSFNDPAKTPNPFGIGRMFFDTSLYGPKVRISTATNGGVAGANEVQRLAISAISGTFTLRFGAQQTAALAFNATAAQVQSSLQALSNIGSGNVTVTFDAVDGVFVITFVGALAGSDQPLLRSETAGLVGGTALNKMRITGFGMGADRTIGGAPQPGGITYEEIEDARVDLGPGNNKFTVDQTHTGKTTINTGRGNDEVYVKTISGHTFVNLGAGSDTITISSDAQRLDQLFGLLTVSGDTPRADVLTLAKGSAAVPAEFVNAVDEIQQVTIDATGGTFTLSLGGHTTAPIAYNAPAKGVGSVTAALEALPSVGAGNVVVNKAGFVYRITFVGALAGSDVALLASNGSGLTNGLGAVDTLNVDDRLTTSDAWALLTSSSLTGLSMPQPNEVQQLVIDATGGTFTMSFGSATTAALAWNVDASVLQAALEGLAGIGAGNVAVTRNDDVYVIRFQGELTNTDVAQLGVDGAGLTRQFEQLGGAVVPAAASATVTTRKHGGTTPATNDVQVLTVSATGGTYRLSLLNGLLTTAPIAYDASAEVVRQALQDAIAMGDVFESLKFDVTVERYENVYVIGFQGNLRRVGGGSGADFLVAETSALTGSLSIRTRMDGIDYYGFEDVNVHTGSGTETFNVQGTTPGSGGFALGGGIAVTNVNLYAGNEHVFVSSNADLDATSRDAFQFLTGNLDDVRGALNLDFGTGRHRLFVSDEAATAGDASVRISDTAPATLGGLSASAEIWITGLAPRGISYRVDPSGNLFDGVVYWSGSGDDGITIDGTHNRAGARTTTLLNTGLGNDTATVSLSAASDGFFTLFTSGGSTTDDPLAIADRTPDDDVVNAAGSSLPLVIFGGFGKDTITGGTGDDLIFGDFGRTQYIDPATGQMVATHGFGGRGDQISDKVVDPRWAISRHLTLGGSDIVQGNAGEDVLVGGAGTGGFGATLPFDDYVDGDTGDDLIFGDAVELFRRDVIPGPANQAQIGDPRFRALVANRIYLRTDLDGGVGEESGAVGALGGDLKYRDPDAGALAFPQWAEYQIKNLFHDDDLEANRANKYGSDYLAGGAGHDVLFAQLGDDVVQGDGNIDGALAGSHSGAFRTPGGAVDPLGPLTVVASPATTADGDDYIEGGGGADVIFGGLGQDDIVGGSSSLYTLDTKSKRPDGADRIFGGRGDQLGLDNEVAGHSADADTIAGDNANIFRLMGTGNADVGALGSLRFNWDNYAGRGIVVRAVAPLDYTPGGPDFRPDLFGSSFSGCGYDRGGADEVHAEGGDDTVYGLCAGDMLYGDAGDDDLIGGWGNDWISGGTGQDGVLGDDGRIFTSRNGLAEPLYGITATTQSTISTPGNMQVSVINATGALNKAVDITPFNLRPNALGADDPLFRPRYADDVIFGGLGDDFLHGASGDDAISGAEALPESYSQRYDVSHVLVGVVRTDFTRPYNPGNLLAWGDDADAWHSDRLGRAGEFALYDEFDPRRKVLLNADGTASKTGSGLEFFLNWNKNAGPLTAVDATYGTKRTDGNDIAFGDLGNDWMVGGTGKDTLWGGWGNDLLNADDDMDATLANDTPDTHPSYEDRAVGGAGLDILIGNTGGDRLIDWVGEFNSYLVPFAPFGMATVSRQVPPGLFDYLYALSRAQGADPTRAADTGNDPARNGEPDGEIGLITQKDSGLWQQQTGAPTDPQPGNIPGGRRDVLRSADFNDGSMAGFAVDSGSFTVSGGALAVSATSTTGDAAAVFYHDQYLPIYYEVLASIQAVKPTAGWDANAFIIFDYFSATDFKFAGIDISTNKISLGHRTASGWQVDAFTPALLKAGQNYAMLVAVNGTAVTVTVDGAQAFTYNFAPRILDGEAVALNKGLIGMGSRSARGRFDNVSVQVLPPAITLDESESFDDGVAQRLTGTQQGTWTIAGGRASSTATTSPSFIDADLGIGRGLKVDSYLELTATLRTTGAGGVVFDQYGTTDYKYVAIDAQTGKVVIGHSSPRAGLTVDLGVAKSILPNVDFTIQVTIKGLAATVTVNGGFVGTVVFNGAAVDGRFGLLALRGTTSFDSFRIRTNDAAFAAVGPTQAGATPAPLTTTSTSSTSTISSSSTTSISSGGTTTISSGATGPPVSKK